MIIDLECLLVVGNGFVGFSCVIVGISKTNEGLKLLFIEFESLKMILDGFLWVAGLEE